MLMQANTSRPRSASVAVTISNYHEDAIAALLSLTSQQQPETPSPATVFNTPSQFSQNTSNEYESFRVTRQELQEIEEFASILSPVNRRRAFSEGFIHHNNSNNRKNINNNNHLYNNDTVSFHQQQQYANINTFRLQNSVQRNSVGIYSPRSRRKRIDRYLAKRKTRVWVKRVKYDVRKNFADSRLRGMFLLFFIKMYILVNVIIYIYNNSHN